MESILRYKDYRKYIRDYYTREKKSLRPILAEVFQACQILVTQFFETGL